MAEKYDRVERLSLPQATQHLLDECRTVLPGIQALFGFQLMVVFSDGFTVRLDETERFLHLGAISLVAVAVALVMTPAAYHRQTRVEEVSEHFLRLCSRLLLWSMWPLAVGISLDFYLIARVVTQAPRLAGVGAVVLLFLFLALWLVLPWRRRRIDRRQRR